MSRWMDELEPPDRAALEQLRAELIAEKPAGWSVVSGLRELVVRPPDRRAGRIGITMINGRFHGVLHDRAKGVWTERAEWPVTASAAEAILAWADRVTREAGPSSGPEAPPNVR